MTIVGDRTHPTSSPRRAWPSRCSAEALDIGLTIHPHPTLGEGVMEAAKAALGEAVHVMNR